MTQTSELDTIAQLKHKERIKMLSFKLDGDILAVTQTTHSFTNTSREYWYYNIKLWMKSITGKEDAAIVQIMDVPQIEWIQKYYLPKVLDTLNRA